MKEKDFDAIFYLTQVLDNWEEFCNSHRKFATAIKLVLEENRHLKEYNHCLQELLLTDE